MERLAAAGVEELEILHAFDAVPRHLFVPAALRQRAYEDVALPLGFDQTISRPSVHARFLQLAELQGTEKVLEVGTGSGFQTALVATLARQVYSVERIPELARRARDRLRRLGLHASVRVGDGSMGWPEEAPFDVILVAAAAEDPPEALSRQLSEGGRLLIPVGDEDRQTIVRIRRTGKGWEREAVDRARFVPLRREESP